MTEEERIQEEEEQEGEPGHMDVIKWISAGFGIGLLIGGIVGLLLAPKSGRETRAQLKSFTSELSDRTRKFTKDLGEKISTTKEAISESIKAGKSKYEEVKKSTQED